MTKIAVIISGQPRFIEQCYPDIYDKILRPNGMPDVFAHLWWSEDDCQKAYKYGGDGGWSNQRIQLNAQDTFVKLYNPVKISIEASKTWKAAHIEKYNNKYFLSANNEPDKPVDRMFNNMVSFWASVYKANVLKKEYEWSNDFRYDYIIRTRSDTVPLDSDINCNNLNPEKFHYANLGQPEDHISDWLNISSSKNMDIAANIWYDFDYLVDTYYNRGNFSYWSNEMLLKTQITRYGIEAVPNFWRLILPRF